MSFICPECRKVSKVLDTRRRSHSEFGNYIYRRHACPKRHKFSTFEYFSPIDDDLGKFTIGATARAHEKDINGEVAKALRRLAYRVEKTGEIE